MSNPIHIPILTAELLDYLQLGPGSRCIDATIDGGGHTAAILERTAPDGQVLGIDRDPELLGRLHARLGEALEAGRLRLCAGDFRELEQIAVGECFAPVNAVIFDLGLSSYHFDVSGRGFTFQHDEPLDMRFNPQEPGTETAAEVLHSRDAAELERIFGRFGEERFSGRIARAVVAERRRQRLQTTTDLLRVITAALPGPVRWQAARSAARVFQALRICVNSELEAVAQALPQALSLLAPGGRLAVLAFHSLEDRIVKQLFVAERQAGRVRILTKKPVRPSETEIAANPRAASAKLRVCERVG